MYLKQYSTIYKPEAADTDEQWNVPQEVYLLKKIGDRQLCFDAVTFDLFLADDDGYALLKKKDRSEAEIAFLSAKRIGYATRSKEAPKVALLCLVPTTRCNLRCVYCYSYGGDNPQEMSWELAKCAIDFKLQEVASRGLDALYLDFSNAGEPTLGLRMIKKCVEYARERAKVIIYVQTNCVFSGSTLDWLIKNCDGIAVSCDGPPSIQDRQRPLVGGGSASRIVERNVAALANSGKEVYVRTTLTEFSAPKQNDIVKYFHKLGVTQVCVEPVAVMGRALIKKEEVWARPPAFSEFMQGFFSAFELADAYGMMYSSALLPDPGRKGRFCGATKNAFLVLPSGDVSMCHQVNNWSSPCYAEFFIGKYDPAKQDIFVNESKVDRIRQRVSRNIPECAQCRFGHSCGGYCALRMVEATQDLFRVAPAYCEMVQEMYERYLMLHAEQKLLGTGNYFSRADKDSTTMLAYKLGRSELGVEVVKDTDAPTQCCVLHIGTAVSGMAQDALCKGSLHKVFISPQYDTHTLNLKKSAISEFVAQLRKKNIATAFTKPLPKCICDGSNLAPMKHVPQRNGNSNNFPCRDCSELFLLEKDGHTSFCKTVREHIPEGVNPIKEGRNSLCDMLEKKIGESALSKDCKKCTYRIRKGCSGLLGNPPCEGVFL